MQKHGVRIRVLLDVSRAMEATRKWLVLVQSLRRQRRKKGARRSGAIARCPPALSSLLQPLYQPQKQFEARRQGVFAFVLFVVLKCMPKVCVRLDLQCRSRENESNAAARIFVDRDAISSQSAFFAPGELVASPKTKCKCFLGSRRFERKPSNAHVHIRFCILSRSEQYGKNLRRRKCRRRRLYRLFDACTHAHTCRINVISSLRPNFSAASLKTICPTTRTR